MEMYVDIYNLDDSKGAATLKKNPPEGLLVFETNAFGKK